MTRKRVSDEQYGNLTRRLDEIKRRVDEGTLDYGATMSAIQTFIEGRIEGQRLTIDYGLMLKKMITAGHYDWTNSDITAGLFPLAGSGIVKCERKLFHFDRPVSSDEAKRLIVAAGWQLGKIEHLLASGAANPSEQREFPVVALGSVAELAGERHAPCLDGGGSWRRLGLGWMGGGWHGDVRFLAVRNLVL